MRKKCALSLFMLKILRFLIQWWWTKCDFIYDFLSYFIPFKLIYQKLTQQLPRMWGMAMHTRTQHKCAGWENPWLTPHSSTVKGTGIRLVKQHGASGKILILSN